MSANDVELARRDAGDFRSVRLQLQADGSLRLHTYDMGPKAPSADGREQSEFWVTVPPEEVGKLAFVLMKERFAGRLQAVTEFRDFCKGNEVVNAFKTSP
ncbi:MAG: hypothetical protein SGI91_08615 [Alphaproteobacteria bacterium]|jgi:hypothetical protein|nr:hypothetical protein [Alphaproteobacteria bacterium]